MTCRSIVTILAAGLAAGALGLGLAACSGDGQTVVTSDAPPAKVETRGEPKPPDPEAAAAPVAEPASSQALRTPIAKAAPPPPVDVIGVQDAVGMRWVGRFLHKDRMSWQAPDPVKDYFIVVIRELTPHHASLGLEVGKAYRYRGTNEFEYIRDVDLSMVDNDIARAFGAYDDKEIDLLLAAAETDDVAALKKLLADGMPADARSRGERPVLLVAAKKGSLGVVRELLDAGAAVDLTDVSGETALHQAANGGHTDVLEFLLERGAALEAKDHLGHTPLFFAAEGNRPEVARILIDRGADVSLKDERGYTPLAYAKVFLRNRLKDDLRELLTPKE